MEHFLGMQLFVVFYGIKIMFSTPPIPHDINIINKTDLAKASSIYEDIFGHISAFNNII
jgi:hypothetical protein